MFTCRTSLKMDYEKSDKNVIKANVIDMKLKTSEENIQTWTINKTDIYVKVVKRVLVYLSGAWENILKLWQYLNNSITLNCK